MISAEQWNEAVDHRSAARAYFAGPHGQAFLQLLYRLGSAPEDIRDGHTPEMELGRLQGFNQCLRLIQGIALGDATAKPETLKEEWLPAEEDEDRDHL